MSENSKLTPEQSNIVRKLSQAVSAFGSISPFTPNALAGGVSNIVSNYGELKTAFPEAADEAAAYYDADFPEEPAEKEGYGDALFNTLLSLRAFYDAESFSRVATAYESLINDVYDLCTFSEEFEVERGFWKSELV